jgi:mannosyltransferase
VSFWGLAGTLAFIYAIEKPNNNRVGLWACLRFLAIMTIPLNVTLLLTDIILLVIRFYKQQRRSLLIFGKWLLFLGVLWTPCILISLAPKTAAFADLPNTKALPAPGLVDFIRIIRTFAIWPYSIQPNTFLSQLLKVAILMLVLLLGIALIRKHKSQNTLWIACWGFIPLIQIFVGSNLFFSLWRDRYLLPAAPYIIMLLAIGFMRIWKQGKVFAGMIALLYTLSLGHGIVHYYSVQDHTDFRGMVHVIRDNEKPDDIVIWAIESWIGTVPLIHYDHGSAKVVVEPTVPSFNKNDNDAYEQEVITWLDRLPTSTSRLWLVCKLRNEKVPELFMEQLEERFDVQMHAKYRYDEKQFLYHVFLVTETSS